MEYLILINEESKPVLVELPQKPRNDIDDPLAYADSWMKYSDEYSKAISDKSKHIRFKDEEQVKILLLKPLPGSVHYLPENISVGFEEEMLPRTKLNQATEGAVTKTVAILTTKPGGLYEIAESVVKSESVSITVDQLKKYVAPSEEVKNNPTEDEIAEFIKSAFQILVAGDKYKMMDYILDSDFRIGRIRK